MPDDAHRPDLERDDVLERLVGEVLREEPRPPDVTVVVDAAYRLHLSDALVAELLGEHELAGVRRGAPEWPKTFVLGDLRVTLDVRPDQRGLLGYVEPVPADLEVLQIRPGEMDPVPAAVDELGRFTVAEAMPSWLEVRRPGKRSYIVDPRARHGSSDSDADE
jgi:hypothetical protein